MILMFLPIGATLSLGPIREHGVKDLNERALRILDGMTYVIPGQAGMCKMERLWPF